MDSAREMKKKELISEASSVEDGRGSQCSKTAQKDLNGNGGNLVVCCVVAFGAIGGILFGLDQTNYGGAMVKSGFGDTFCLDNFGDATECDPRCNTNFNATFESCEVPSEWTDFKSWGASIIQLGAVAGALVLAPQVVNNFGRRFALSFGGIFVAATMLWTALSSATGMFLAARFFVGVGVGLITYTLPIFNSEVAPAHIRGILGSTMQLSCVIGSQIAAGYNIPSNITWQLSLGIPIIPAVIVGVGIWMFPPSPRFVMKKKGKEQAEKVLVQLRQTENVQEELDMIAQGIAAEREQVSYSYLVTNKSIRRRVIIANLLQWFQQFTGVNAMVGFGPQIFISMGLPMHGITANFIAQGFNLVGTVIMMAVIDRLGRRPLLLGGALTMFLTMGGAGLLDLLWVTNTSAVKAWIMFALLCVYFLGFAIAWGGVPWVYPSEIFPMDVKEKALATSVASQWLANFTIAQITLRLVDSWGIGWTFIFFSAFLMGAFFFVHFFVPETKGIPLECMDEVFGARETIALPEKRSNGNMTVTTPTTDF